MCSKERQRRPNANPRSANEREFNFEGHYLSIASELLRTCPVRRDRLAVGRQGFAMVSAWVLQCPCNAFCNDAMVVLPKSHVRSRAGFSCMQFAILLVSLPNKAMGNRRTCNNGTTKNKNREKQNNNHDHNNITNTSVINSIASNNTNHWPQRV